MSRAARLPAPAPRADRDLPVGPARDLLAVLAVATTSAFAAGCLLTQTVIVPLWRSTDPAAFLTRFAASGPATGATLFPIEVVATLALAGCTYVAIRNHRPARWLWALSTACMVGTLLLLPIYFAGANLAMLDDAFPAANVPGELATWNAWNWARTGLATIATVLCCLAPHWCRDPSARSDTPT